MKDKTNEATDPRNIWGIQPLSQNWFLKWITKFDCWFIFLDYVCNRCNIWSTNILCNIKYKRRSIYFVLQYTYIWILVAYFYGTCFCINRIVRVIFQNKLKAWPDTNDKRCFQCIDCYLATKYTNRPWLMIAMDKQT